MSKFTMSQSCRKRLQSKFDESAQVNNKTEDGSVLSTISFNNFNDSTRKALRNGANRICKSFHQFKTSFGAFSQKFKIPTKRRQILEEGPMTPQSHIDGATTTTPHTFSKEILGRTPTKLYSPFGIETPSHWKNTNNGNRVTLTGNGSNQNVKCQNVETDGKKFNYFKKTNKADDPKKFQRMFDDNNKENLS